MESDYRELRDDMHSERDALDRALDAGLANYAAVEPRSELEERILVRLRSEKDMTPKRFCREWSAFAAATAVLVIAIAFAWKSSKPAKTVVQRSAPIRVTLPSATHVAANGETESGRTLRQRHEATRQWVDRREAMAGEPKLDQFPSPEPLTKEELALVHYVRQFPQDAVMVASAQEEFEKEVQQEAAVIGQTSSNSTEEER